MYLTCIVRCTDVHQGHNSNNYYSVECVSFLQIALAIIRIKRFLLIVVKFTMFKPILPDNLCFFLFIYSVKFTDMGLNFLSTHTSIM